MNANTATTQTRFNRVDVRSIRRRTVGSLVVLTLVPSPLVFAQASFEDLGLRINLEDRVRVEDQSGNRTGGRVAGLTFDEIVIRTAAGERRFPRASVRDVAVRGYRLRKSALIGAGVFAVLGAVAMCAHGEENCAAAGPLAAAPIGAGLGLATGALIPRMRNVYRASGDREPVRTSVAGAPAGFLADIALRVNIDDQVRVQDRSGGSTTGRLTRLTPDELTVRTRAGEKHFRRASIAAVSVRRRPFRVAVLVGAGAGASTGAGAACVRSNRDECADAAIIGGALGAGSGFVVGALMSRTEVVYLDAGAQTRVMPLISRDAVGVTIGRSW